MMKDGCKELSALTITSHYLSRISWYGNASMPLLFIMLNEESSSEFNKNIKACCFIVSANKIRAIVCIQHLYLNVLNKLSHIHTTASI